MKATGAEIWAFYQEWPPGGNWYHDEYAEPIVDDDAGETCVLKPTAKYDLADFGVMVWQGGDAAPTEVRTPSRLPCPLPANHGGPHYYPEWRLKPPGVR